MTRRHLLTMLAITAALGALLLAGAVLYLGPMRVARKLYHMAFGYPPVYPTYQVTCIDKLPDYMPLTRYPLNADAYEERYVNKGLMYLPPFGLEFDYDVTIYEGDGDWTVAWHGCTRRFGYVPVSAKSDGDRLAVELCMGKDSHVKYWLTACADKGTLEFAE